MQVTLTRDAVANGDDPDSRELDLPGDPTLADVVDAVVRGRFLPRIQGGEATWVAVVGSAAVAVVAQQWPTPRWATAPHVPAPSRLHLRYLAQRDPDGVFAGLGG
jgi:hypothetical protein